MTTMSLLALHADQQMSMFPMHTSNLAFRYILLSQWQPARYVFPKVSILPKPHV